MAVGVLKMDMAYIALSTDTKPTNPTYRLLYEVDTGAWFAWNGTAWVEFFVPGEPAA